MRETAWCRLAAAALALVAAAGASGQGAGVAGRCPGGGGGVLEAPWDDYRPFLEALAPAYRKLPAELRQASVYHLELVAAENLSALEGSLRVRYTNRQERPLRAVSVFLFPNLIQGAFALRSASVDGLPVQPGYPLGRHLASGPLPAPLAPGARVELALEYPPPARRLGAGRPRQRQGARGAGGRHPIHRGPRTGARPVPGGPAGLCPQGAQGGGDHGGQPGPARRGAGRGAGGGGGRAQPARLPAAFRALSLRPVDLPGRAVRLLWAGVFRDRAAGFPAV